jgi:multidrug efflux system outer membrane protein
MNRVSLLVSALFLFVLACSRPIARPERTLNVATPPSIWKSGATSAESISTEWWDYLSDQGLDRAIRRALTYNHDLRAAAARVAAAEAEIIIAHADGRPSLQAAIGRTRQKQNFVGFPIPGFEGQVLSRTFTSAGASLDASWEPDLWGRIKASKLAAKATFEAREADVAAARLSLSGQVAKAWFAAIEAQRQVELSKASLANYRTSVAHVRSRFESGLRPLLDLRLALTEVDRAGALVSQRLEQQRRAIRQLEILLGQYPSGQLTFGKDLPSVPTHVPAGLPAELAYRRPDLASAERELLAADARIIVSKAELRPRFPLTASGGTASDALRNLLDRNFSAWNFLASFAQPIFNRGRLKAMVRRDEAIAREAMARYEGVILIAYGEVESALAADGALAHRMDALTSAAHQSMLAKEEAEHRYRVGLTDIITVLSAQRAALDSESQLFNVHRLRLDNRVDLHLALGGGFQATRGSVRDPKVLSRPVLDDQTSRGDEVKAL